MPAVRCASMASCITVAAYKSTCIRSSSAPGQSQRVCRWAEQANTALVHARAPGARNRASTSAAARDANKRQSAPRAMLGDVRSLCTLLAALAPLVAWGAEPGLGADAGRAYIVREQTGERLEVAAQLVFDHRPSATAAGGPRLVPVRWKSDATATLTTPDGAFDAVLRIERTDVGTVQLVLDGQWRRPTWVHVMALDVVLPADAVTLLGRDLEPVAAPPLAVLERFDPKEMAIRRGDKGYTLVVDDDVDDVVVKSGGGRVSLRIELETSEARPFVHDAACRTEWRMPNAHVPVPARLRTVDEHVHARLQWIPDLAPLVAKAKFPDGRRAAFTITDHADQTTARTFAALVYGRSD